MTVSIVNSSYKTVLPKIKKALKLISYKPKNDKILLKPNIVNAWEPKSAIVTHPEFTKAVIEYFHDQGCEVTIGEGSVVGLDTKIAFKASGYEDLAKEYNIKLVDFNDVERVSKDWKFGTLNLPKILETHEYINLPKLKTHMQTSISVATKNQKGLLSPDDKKSFHMKKNLEKYILEYGNLVKPSLNIVDGILAMEGNGPGTFGDPKKVNKIIAGESTSEVDTVCAKLMGFNPDKISHFTTHRGIKVVGEELIPLNFKKPENYYRFLNVYCWAGSACSGCINNMSAAIKSVYKSPANAIHLAFKGGLTRRDILVGKHEKLDPNLVDCLCIGNCSREVAEKKGFKFIHGCPPAVSKIRKKL